MRILSIIVALCTLLGTGCTSEKSDYDAGIAAYERGHYEAALYDFESRALKGDPVAQFCLGFMYKHGLGVAQTLKKAEEWYTKSAEQDYAPAQNNLALMYVRRAHDAKKKVLEDISKEAEDVQSYFDTAGQWFQKVAVKGNNTIAQYNLALIRYYQAVFLDQLAKEKDKFLQYRPEDSEDPKVQKILEMVRNWPARAVEEYEEAVYWFTIAAEKDYTLAQYRLALIYASGEGVDKNLTEAERWKEAVKWYTEAAENGNALAQNNLASMYESGEGVDKNLTEAERWKEAVKWYTEAAENGNALAQFNLALMYKSGEGVDKNLTKAERWKEAVKWYTKAAKQGHAAAQNNLAVMYKGGEEMPKNPEIATRWYFQAAQQDHPIAQKNIGELFEIGYDQVPQDNEEAYYWYSLAIKHKTELAEERLELVAELDEALERVGNKLTEEKKNEIQERIDNWKPRFLSSYGTGFYIDKKHILTNAHVVRFEYPPGSGKWHEYDELRIGYRYVREKPDTKSVNLEVDLALLLGPRENTDPFATFRSTPVDEGEDIASFGYPLSHLLSYRGNGTSGIVSGLSGMITGPQPDSYFQHTAPIQGGNSGGPVFDLAGNVVGVTKYGLIGRVKVKRDPTPQIIRINPPQNANFAIKFNVIEDFLRENGIDYTPTDNLDGPITREAIDEEARRKAIYKTARKFTVPVLCFKNKDEEPLPVVEIDIEGLNR